MIQLIHHWQDEDIYTMASPREIFEDHYANYTQNRVVWDHMLDLEKQGLEIIFEIKDSVGFESHQYTASIFQSKNEEELFYYENTHYNT